MTKKSDVVDFASELLKRKGIKLKKPKPQKQLKVGQESLVTKLALQILKVLEPHKKSNPIATASAVLLVGHTLIREYTDTIGSSKTRELVELAENISQRFKAEYSNARPDDEVAGDQEDKPER